MVSSRGLSCVRMRCAVLFLFALILNLNTASAAAQPQVNKVEPPNWWVGLPPSPVLLLTGEGLAEVKVSTSYPGVKVEQVQAQADGRHAFVWLTIARETRAGNVELDIVSACGKSRIQFPLQERNRAEAAREGLTADDVVYLIMPDRFANGDTANDSPRGAAAGTTDREDLRAYHGGDLKGIREHLPYLKELGVTTLWLTPITASALESSDYHGYHPVDYYAVDQHLGTMADYRSLIADAHKIGMKVFIDFIVNHAGPRHPWADAPPTATWLNGTPQKHPTPEYDFWRLMDPHSTARQKRGVLEGWFANALPDLNVDNPLVATYLLQNAEWWKETSGADGFRLDTLPYSSRKFWGEWHKGVFTAYPKTTSIGEAWNFDPAVTSFFQGGRRQYDGIDTGVTSVFDFPFFNTVRDVLLHGESAKKLEELFKRDALYPNSNLLVPFIGSHDTSRFMGEENATPAKLKAAFSLLVTVRGIPQLYAGDEIGMKGGGDPDNRRDFPGGFPGDTHNAFTAAGRSQQEHEIFAYVQQLLKVRRDHAALRVGSQWNLDAGDSSYAFARQYGDDKLVVLLNNSNTVQTIRLNLDGTPLAAVTSAQSILNGGTVSVENKIMQIQAAPNTVAIYAVK